MRLLVHGLAGYTKGGIETFVLGMAEHMSDDIIFDYVIEKDGSDVRMPDEGDTLFIEPKRQMLKNLKSWSKLLKERKRIDSAVYFNWYSMAWLFPAMIARAKGYRVIIHAHNNNLHDCGKLQRFMHATNRQIQKSMKITRLTNSDLSARFFFGNKPAEMIYNAIDTAKFAFNDETRKRIREELNIADQNVYGSAGRIAYQKNPLFLMEIFREIKNKDNKAAFLVCGDGDLIEETKEKANEYGLDIIFTGSVPNVQDYYQAMDVFILPSRFEGLGIVLIEAQCSGLPCVASDEVIPKDVEITDLVSFISLNGGTEKWAEEAISQNDHVHPRSLYADKIANTRFNLSTESELLKRILINSCKEDK